MNDNINEYTWQLEALLLKIAEAASDNKKEYFIGEGFAIDIFLGKISRNHHDIDFHPMLEDSLWWLEWFKKLGYKVRNRQDAKFPETWNVYNSEGEAIVDMWPFRLENGLLLINHEGKYSDGGRHWEEMNLTNYRGVKIKIENPERVLEQKSRNAKHGQNYRPKDLHDFRLLGKEPK